MKKGQVYEGSVVRVDFPNKGIVCVGEETAVVKNSLPGQKVKFSVNKVRKGKAEGRLLEVTEKSPLETGRTCSLFGLCGGCTYLSLPYEEQLKVKEEQVKRLLDSVLNKQEEAWAFEGIKGSPKAYEYRNKMEFSFGDEEKDGDLALGMRKRMSYYEVVTLKDCNIVDADYLRIIEGTLQFFQERKVPFYHKARHDGSLRHLVVRKGAATGEILINLVTSSEVPFSVEEFKDMLLGLELDGSVCGILHSVNDGLADVVKSDEMRLLYGRDFFMEKLFDLEFKVSVYSFFQTNSLGAEVLYETAREYIGDTKGRKVFDLYSGTGTIAQILAPAAEHVTGVEIVEEAVEAAKINAQRNGLTNCDFIAGDVLKVLDTLEERPDLIVLDPPRDGIHPKALPKIIKYGVDHMVYISCKPTSLARDLVVLQAGGYTAKRICCVDMFPATTGIETVCLLVLRNPVTHINIDVDVEEMVQDKRGMATYGQIKEYVLEHSGLKVSSLYIAQVKQKHGIIERENYNKPKSDDARQPQCPLEKERAITEALKHFGML